MEIFQIENKDQHIWNIDKITPKLFDYFTNHEEYFIGTSGEGPCFRSSGIEEFVIDVANLAQVDLGRITLVNGNLLKSAKKLKEKTVNSLHEIKDYQRFINENNILPSKQIEKHFGHFVGRSNFLRLWIATYLFKNHKEKSLQTFHWTANNLYHSNHLDLEYLLNLTQDFELINDCVNFLSNCPIVSDQVNQYPILKDHNHIIRKKYKTIFVDIICESYWSGNVFFVTEKTWRPIEQLTPFIVQGPEKFLKNLKQLGFQTFDRWWSEDYDRYSFYTKAQQINNLVDYLGNWSIEKCNQVYKEMMPVLLHNREVLRNLKWAKIKKTEFFNTERNSP